MSRGLGDVYKRQVYSFYRRMLALRKSDKTFVYGHYALLLPDDEEIYAYTRTLNDEQILVVCNFTDHDVPCPLLNDWQNTELLISNYTPPDPPEVCDRLKRWFTESKTQRINLNPTLYYLKMQVVAGAVTGTAYITYNLPCRYRFPCGNGSLRHVGVPR